MSSEMELVVDAGGDVRCIYGEELDLREIGKLQITRASHVEPDRDGFWWADMGPVDGPVLGPYGSRSEALQAERGWLAVRAVPSSTSTASRTSRASHLLGVIGSVDPTTGRRTVYCSGRP
jgi:hypothetical protein